MSTTNFARKGRIIPITTPEITTHETINGLPVEIYRKNNTYNNKIIGAFYENGTWHAQTWFASGQLLEGQRTPIDIKM